MGSSSSTSHAASPLHLSPLHGAETLVQKQIPKDGFGFDIQLVGLLGRWVLSLTSRQKRADLLQFLPSGIRSRAVVMPPGAVPRAQHCGDPRVLGDVPQVFHTEAQIGIGAACETFYLFSPLKPFQADFGLDCWLTFFFNLYFFIAINVTNISHGVLHVIGRRVIKKQNKPQTRL